MKSSDKIGLIVLAAGSSSRLGKPKQLVKFQNKTLLQNTMSAAEDLKFSAKMLVLGANAEEIEKSLSKGDFVIIYNNLWEEGMASSIREGIRNLPKDTEHAIIMVCDQPLVEPAILTKLIERQLRTKTDATFSEYAGNIGVPAIFSKTVFSELAQLKGDQGARKLIAQNKLDYKTIQFESGVFDVDTEADVQRLKEMDKQSKIE